MRLLLLRHQDRLKTLAALHKGWGNFRTGDCGEYDKCVTSNMWHLPRVFDATAFSSFKDVELIEAARQYAAAGDMSSLNVIVQHHPLALGPSILQILEAIPETMDPRLYAALLPRVREAIRDKGRIRQ